MSKTVEPINYNIYYISQCVDLFRTNGISSGYRWYAPSRKPTKLRFRFSSLTGEKKTGKPKWTRRVWFIRTCWILLNKFTICTIYSITCSNVIYHVYCRRKFRSQTSDNMDRWKAEQGRGREKRKIRREKIRRGKSQKKEDADARKGKKVAKHCVFPMICGSGGSKSRLAKAAGAEPAGQMRDENLHAVVARSTFWSQNVQNTPLSDHFWKLRCRKSARRCGAKHIWKSKCTKHTILGPLLEVEMLKKCTQLWRKEHFEVKMYKTHQVRTTFGSWDVEKVHAVVARSTVWSQNVQSTPLSDHFWKLRCWKSARRCGAKHISKSKCAKHHMLAPLLEVRMLKKCTPLWREAHFEVKMDKTHQRRTTFGSWDVEKVHAVVASKCTKHQGVRTTLEVQMSLRFKTLHYRTLHYTTLQYTTLRYITLQYTPLH